MSISHDSRLLVAALEGGEVNVWEVNTGNLRYILAKSNNETVRAVALSPDQVHICVRVLDPDLEVWHMPTRTRVYDLERRTPSLELDFPVAYSPDGCWVIAADRAQINLWNAMTGELQYTIVNSLDYNAKLNFSPDGQALFNGFDYVKLPGSVPRMTSSIDPKVPESLTIEGLWIMRDQERILWLPEEFRPKWSGHLFCPLRGNVLFLGYGSGRRAFLEIDPQMGRRWPETPTTVAHEVSEDEKAEYQR